MNSYIQGLILGEKCCLYAFIYSSYTYYTLNISMETEIAVIRENMLKCFDIIRLWL